ncbi:hypothetical protein PM082_015581 [Marasmius tenuissimus]|nr:hypothetical protein PM082_015581 [Marasmius tenuissimus]
MSALFLIVVFMTPRPCFCTPKHDYVRRTQPRIIGSSGRTYHAIQMILYRMTMNHFHLLLLEGSGFSLLDGRTSFDALMPALAEHFCFFLAALGQAPL